MNKNQMTFQQWKKRNFDLVEMLVKCPECRGTGEAECPCCGNYCECDKCHGARKVINLGKGRTVTLSALYHLQLRRDREFLEKGKYRPGIEAIVGNLTSGSTLTGSIVPLESRRLQTSYL